MTTSKQKIKSPDHRFGRREFLAGTAASLGLGSLAFSGCSPEAHLEENQEDANVMPEEKTFQGVCRGNCGGGCRMNVHVRDGKVVKTSKIDAENPMDTRICQKGLSHAQRMYAPERIQYPLRRVEGTARGAGEWERISWDEAIEEIATKWKGWIEDLGPYSIGFQRGGAGTYAYNQYVYSRLANMIGAVSFETGYDMAALEMANQLVANFSGLYLAGNDVRDVQNAKNIFTWACNTTISNLPRWPYTREAINKGAKRIVIDPIYTDAASKADIWVPIRPATDGALALAMMNVIISNGLADEEYLTRNTVAPFLVKSSDGHFLRLSDLGIEPTEGPVNPMTGQPTTIDPHVVANGAGEHGPLEEISDPAISGISSVENIEVSTAYDLLVRRVSEWTPEKASEICDISPELIEELAFLYCDGPSHLELGFGNDHWGNGATITHCQFTLAMVAGQFGISGGGIGGNQGQSATGMAQGDMVGLLYPDGAQYTGISTGIAYLPEIMRTGQYGEAEVPLKTLFIACSNFLSTFPERNVLESSLDKLELIICCDWLMTDTARYSDIVLPVAHWFEFETLNPTPTPYIDFNEIAVEPQFECKSDIEIARLLGIELGYSETMDLDAESYHRIILDTDECREAGITWETLKEQKHIQHAPDRYIYGNVEEVPFSTATGRGEFYIEDVVPRFNIGQELDSETLSLPSFELPLEGWVESVGGYEKFPEAEKYPLILISHRDKFKVHTTFALHPWFLEIQPEPTIQINSVDAEARGIGEGDYVRAFNDRGSAVFKAHIDAGMRPGMIWTEHTWAQEQYKSGVYTSLLSAEVRHHKPAPELFDALVEVEKSEEEGN